MYLLNIPVVKAALEEFFALDDGDAANKSFLLSLGTRFFGEGGTIPQMISLREDYPGANLSFIIANGAKPSLYLRGEGAIPPPYRTRLGNETNV